jgi:peptidoglycan-associated lipoprotein
MVAFLSIGCASKKPENTQVDAAQDVEFENQGMTLELNGDSDSAKAGGLMTVYFPFESSELNKETKETLRTNADYLKANTNVDIQIEGHTDERGGRQYNLALGERRAKSVKDYLTALGVNSKRISTISYGSERPKAEGSDETSWAQNRRANFVITAK